MKMICRKENNRWTNQKYFIMFQFKALDEQLQSTTRVPFDKDKIFDMYQTQEKILCYRIV